MPLEGLRWSRDSGSALCVTPQTAVLGRAGGGNGLVWKSCNFAASKSQTNKFLEKIGCYQTFASKLAGLYVASILVK